MTFKRASGVLLHPTSLPSHFGIGDLGKSAYEFLDFLANSGQALWQILPLGPTGYEHSPYIMNFSTFAGNPLLISLEKLAEEGLLPKESLQPLTGDDISPHRVNFDRVITHKAPLLERAFQQFQTTLPNADFAAFCQKTPWLEDYALFMALLEAHDGKPWSQWAPELARRQPEALKAKSEELKDRVLYHQFTQYKFFQQWTELRQYANQKGIQIIGDISIYVCHNSSDVWAQPNIFQLNPETLESAYIAGVPPDYFSATGQLWGNPVYDWDELKKTNYAWWIERFRATLAYADLVRIDHFRGFEAYWRVPAGEETAINGEWVLAPGQEFFRTLGQALGSLPVLAEDLGIITPEVEALRDEFEFPGMKILQFAFDGDPNNAYLPEYYPENCVVYAGTHDNDTTIGWWQSSDLEQKQRVVSYLKLGSADQVQEINWTFMELALASKANQAVLTLQDILGLDGSARMNDPSVNAGNWRWRYESSEQLTTELGQRLLQLTKQYNRC
ncbi:MAG: 4-alpha-glucanotransferase [Microcoleaceae cyanobacterium]